MTRPHKVLVSRNVLKGMALAFDDAAKMAPTQGFEILAERCRLYAEHGTNPAPTLRKRLKKLSRGYDRLVKEAHGG